MMKRLGLGAGSSLPKSLGFCQINGHVDCSASHYRERFHQNANLWSQYRDRVREAREGGSPKALHRHTVVKRKLLVRDRLRLLLDNDTSFMELGSLAGAGMDYGDVAAAGTVAGIGRVSGQLCMIIGNDATVKGGTIFPISLKKFLRSQEIAHHLRLPCIHMVDSGGAFLPLQIAVVCGNCTAGGAYTPTMCDDSVIVDRVGSLFLGGPPLVKAATGEEVTEEELGGASLHCRFSGSTDYFAPDEESAFHLCRDTVKTLEQEERNILSDSQELEPIFSAAELQGLAGSHSPDVSLVYKVLSRILDGSQFSEFRQLYGKSLVCGYGHVGSKLIGLVASVGLAMDAKSASKAAQFVQMSNERNIPLVFLQKSLHTGWEQSDSNEVIKHVAQLISVVSTCTVPKITLNIGDCFGADYFAMCGKSLNPAFYMAWPNAQLAYSKEEEKSEESSAFYAASRMWIDEIILPQNTRKMLIKCLEALPKRLKSAQTAQKGVLRM